MKIVLKFLKTITIYYQRSCLLAVIIITLIPINFIIMFECYKELRLLFAVYITNELCFSFVMMGL